MRVLKFRESERGQTIPFWAISVALVLALVFFVASYANTILWQIHAQNAADSAAQAALSPTANVLNQETTLLYSSAVDEYRLRYLTQAILNNINFCQLPPVSHSASQCQTQYTSLLNEYNSALGAYQNLYTTMQEADNYTEGGQQADEKKALSNGSAHDSAFTYTYLDGSQYTGKNKKQGRRQIDVVACRKVPYFAPQLMGLSAGASFLALAQAAAVAVPLIASGTPPASPAGAPSPPPGFSEYFNPAPASGTTYQNSEDPASTGNSTYFTVNFSNLLVDMNWYSGASIQPYKSAASVTC